MKLKVMAVDDEPAILSILKGLLESRDCEVLTVADSREAASRLREEKVDGLFVDVRMPNVDGFELTRSVRETRLNRQVPIVMLTALDDVETMRKGFEVGISFFLGKPFTRERVYNLYGATRGPMLREKLRYARMPYRTTVECTWGANGTGRFKTSSHDISEGGMQLRPSDGLEVGDEVEMVFSLPNISNRTKAKGRVVRKVAPNGVGLMFTGLGVRDAQALQNCISTLLED